LTGVIGTRTLRRPGAGTGRTNLAAVEKTLRSLKPGALAPLYAQACQVVVELRKKDEKTHTVPAMYFKNSISQRKLNASLAGTNEV